MQVPGTLPGTQTGRQVTELGSSSLPPTDAQSPVPSRPSPSRPRQTLTSLDEPLLPPHNHTSASLPLPPPSPLFFPFSAVVAAASLPRTSSTSSAQHLNIRSLNRYPAVAPLRLAPSPPPPFRDSTGHHHQNRTTSPPVRDDEHDFPRRSPRTQRPTLPPSPDPATAALVDLSHPPLQRRQDDAEYDDEPTAATSTLLDQHYSTRPGPVRDSPLGACLDIPDLGFRFLPLELPTILVRLPT